MPNIESQSNQHDITFFVDDEPIQTAEKEATAKHIIELAKLDPTKHYLIEITGQAQHSFKDTPDAVIHLHPKQRFVTRFCGPVTVS